MLGHEGQWREGRDPWTLDRDGDRLYGRGTVDNKGQHGIALAALEAVLAERGRLGFNARLLVETSEETGSKGLRSFAEANRERLAADVLIASDGPRVAPDRPTVRFLFGVPEITATRPAEIGGDSSMAFYQLFRRRAGCGEEYTSISSFGLGTKFDDNGFSSLDAGIYIYAVVVRNGDIEDSPKSLGVEVDTDGNVVNLAWAGNAATCPGW